VESAASQEEPQEDPLAGTWVFNDTLTFTNEFIYYLNFTPFSGVECSGLKSYQDGRYWCLDYLEFGSIWDLKYDGEWYSPSYQTIFISSKLSDVEHGEEFLTWLQANAVKQSS